MVVDPPPSPAIPQEGSRWFPSECGQPAADGGLFDPRRIVCGSLRPVGGEQDDDLWMMLIWVNFYILLQAHESTEPWESWLIREIIPVYG